MLIDIHFYGVLVMLIEGKMCDSTNEGEISRIMKSTTIRSEQKGNAFTLIELLIVVLIIAILAAIAVPNFLEFQTRAKVSRVMSDLRAIAIGVEAYNVDNDSYPPDQDNNPYENSEPGFRLLSTPIAYLTSAANLNDPFSRPLQEDNPNLPDIAPSYQMGSGADANREGGNLTLIQCYVLFSFGPDQLHDMVNDDFPYNTNIRSFYDPTNGTLSAGELLRFGGEYKSGNWTVEGLSYQTWDVKEVYP